MAEFRRKQGVVEACQFFVGRCDGKDGKSLAGASLDQRGDE